MNKLILTLFIFLQFVTVNALDIITYEQRTTSPSPLATFHKIKKSENVYMIAKKYSVSNSELIRINKLSPPYNLKVGDFLKLPKAKRYLIKKKDTLYSLSRKFNVSVRDLATLNDLTKNTKLQAGKYINIPNIAFSKEENKTNNKKKQVVNNTNNFSDGAFSRKKVKLIQENLVKKKKSVVKTLKSTGRFIIPTNGKIISKFGKKSSGVYNDGINISATTGTKVVASDNGVVAYAGNGLKAFGNMVLIKHDKNFITVYAHMDKLKVKIGQKVRQNQIIGAVGSTGKVKIPQLHFQIRKKRQILNPYKYLK